MALNARLFGSETVDIETDSLTVTAATVNEAVADYNISSTTWDLLIGNLSNFKANGQRIITAADQNVQVTEFQSTNDYALTLVHAPIPFDGTATGAVPVTGLTKSGNSFIITKKGMYCFYVQLDTSATSSVKMIAQVDSVNFDGFSGTGYLIDTTTPDIHASMNAYFWYMNPTDATHTFTFTACGVSIPTGTTVRALSDIQIQRIINY
jgi:hypothetical protein